MSLVFNHPTSKNPPVQFTEDKRGTTGPDCACTMQAHPLQPLAHAIRFRPLMPSSAPPEGHQGVPLGMAEIATALYVNHLKFNLADPTW